MDFKEFTDTTSENQQVKSVEQLKELFPEVVEDNGKINFEKLELILAEFDQVNMDDERYEFSWPGKKQAIKLAQTPTTATMLPLIGKSENWDETENIYIEGDNLESLKLLQKAYSDSVKVIYLDPPYNTGHDFVYKDSFADNIKHYFEVTNQQDEDGTYLSTNRETDGRFHTNWLNMIYPRIKLARNLLTQDGVIFVSIDENEVDNLIKVMNEIFGEANRLAVLGWQKVYAPKNQSTYFSNDYEYVLAYAKSKDNVKILDLPRTEEMNARYKNPDNDPRGDWKSGDLIANEERKGGHYPVVSPSGKVFDSPQGKHWSYSETRMKELLAENRIWFGKDGNSFPSIKQFLSEMTRGKKASSFLPFKDYGHTDMAKKDVIKLFKDFEKVPFDTPKPIKLVSTLVRLISNDENDIVLDAFAGSATTADSVMQLSAEDGIKRRWILINLPEKFASESEAYAKGFENIAELGEERIRRAGVQMKTEDPMNVNSVDYGFKVFKLGQTNFLAWDADALNSGQTNLRFESDNVKQGRDNVDVLYEIMLKKGIDLSSPVTATDVPGGMLFDVNFGSLFVVLGDAIDHSVANKIIQKRKDYVVDGLFITSNVIFVDSSFSSTEEKLNALSVLADGGYNPDEIESI